MSQNVPASMIARLCTYFEGGAARTPTADNSRAAMQAWFLPWKLPLVVPEESRAYPTVAFF